MAVPPPPTPTSLGRCGAHLGAFLERACLDIDAVLYDGRTNAADATTMDGPDEPKDWLKKVAGQGPVLHVAETAAGVLMCVASAFFAATSEQNVGHGVNVADPLARLIDEDGLYEPQRDAATGGPVADAFSLHPTWGPRFGGGELYLFTPASNNYTDACAASTGKFVGWKAKAPANLQPVRRVTAYRLKRVAAYRHADPARRLDVDAAPHVFLEAARRQQAALCLAPVARPGTGKSTFLRALLSALRQGRLPDGLGPEAGLPAGRRQLTVKANRMDAFEVAGGATPAPPGFTLWLRDTMGVVGADPRSEVFPLLAHLSGLVAQNAEYDPAAAAAAAAQATVGDATHCLFVLIPQEVAVAAADSAPAAWDAHDVAFYELVDQTVAKREYKANWRGAAGAPLPKDVPTFVVVMKVDAYCKERGIDDRSVLLMSKETGPLADVYRGAEKFTGKRRSVITALGWLDHPDVDWKNKDEPVVVAVRALLRDAVESAAAFRKALA